MSANDQEAQKATIAAFLEGWRVLDIEKMIAVRDENCRQFLLPERSVGYGGISNEAFAEQMRPGFRSLSDFKCEVVDVLHDFAAGVSVVHGKTAGESPVGPYRNEHIMLIHMTENREKIIKIDDMFDSAFIQAYQPKLMEYLAKEKQ